MVSLEVIQVPVERQHKLTQQNETEDLNSRKKETFFPSRSGIQSNGQSWMDSTRKVALTWEASRGRMRATEPPSARPERRLHGAKKSSHNTTAPSARKAHKNTGKGDGENARPRH